MRICGFIFWRVFPFNFAQDEVNVFYLDHMTDFIDLFAHTDVQLDYEDIPLFYLGDVLFSRRCHMFNVVNCINKVMSILHSEKIFVILACINYNDGRLL